MKKVCVIIPIYRTELNEYEMISVVQSAKALNNRDIIIIKPEGLNTDEIERKINSSRTESFAPDYFKGIPGYNRLMMSAEFYKRFIDYEYVLICQTDAYVFDDDLDRWCDTGYDYVGAPWLVRPIYNHPVLKLGSWIKHKFRSLTGKPNLKVTWWKVGNGGISLRKTNSHLKAVESLSSVVAHFIDNPGNHIFNEDVFFSTEVNKHGLGFKYPTWQEALKFSFDKYPALCFQLNGEKLPMGCHAWYKRRMRKFWFPIILGKKMSD